MKICLIGAGSFVFGPSVLYDAIIEHQIDGLHLALVDPRLEMAEIMVGLGQQMAISAGINVTITAHSEWRDALDGTDFVICCAAVELQRRFAMDVDLIHQHYPEHLITEFGGVQGISYSLRQIAMIRNLAKDMKAICPDAWLLTSANPLPRVCQAAHELGVRTAGFCNNSMGGYHLIGRMLQNLDENYPWPQATERYEAIMAGINHFTFALQLIDKSSSTDVLKDFISIAQQQNVFEPRTAELVKLTGCWPSNGDAHMRDFLIPNSDSTPLELTSHGTVSEREAHLASLKAAANGSGPWKPLLTHRAWEKPVDFAVAVNGGKKVKFHSLNLVNDGQLPDLPNGIFVETPTVVDADGPHPSHLLLPESVAKMSVLQAKINDIIVRASLTDDFSLLDEAIDLDLTVTDKQAGRRALKACLSAHDDLLK
jgi:alpha-galactosidase